MVKNPPVMQETWVPSLGQEDPLEEGMATHSGIPAWRTPWAEEPGRLQSMVLQESDRTERLNPTTTDTREVNVQCETLAALLPCTWHRPTASVTARTLGAPDASWGSGPLHRACWL